MNASDISALKAHLTQTANVTNFTFDLNADEAVTGADLSAVKSRSGQSIP